jgi:hypothetical protein
MSKILISYRREDSADISGRVYDRLITQFGRDSVFKDVDSIPFGVDFRIYLDSQVAKCHVFLAVIGPDWMKTRSWGKSRLENPKDFVRIEIESALKRAIPVIPVLVRGSTIPVARRLPASIQDLAYRQAIAIRPDPDFHRDMDRLIEYLNQQIQSSHEHLARQSRAVTLAEEASKMVPPVETVTSPPEKQEVISFIIGPDHVTSESDGVEAGSTAVAEVPTTENITPVETLALQWSFRNHRRVRPASMQAKYPEAQLQVKIFILPRQRPLSSMPAHSASSTGRLVGASR